VGIDKVWSTIDERYAAAISAGQLNERRNRQNLRWLWSTVDDRLAQAVRTHPAVHKLHAELEAKVLAGQITPESAAHQILEAFGIS
jgi:LAO/AO transport system kinase